MTKNLPPLVAALLVVSLPAWLTPLPLVLQGSQPLSIPSVLSSLFLIALLQERALEVFITTWRGPDSTALETALKAAQEQLVLAGTANPVVPATVTVATANVVAANGALNSYRAETQRIALWTGLILGMLMSAVGIRALTTLVTSSSLGALLGPHKDLFRMTDVLVTGGLIGGGSEGLHKLTQVYTDFMEETAKKIKAQP